MTFILVAAAAMFNAAMDRLENEIFYIFTDGGIESKIYKSVINKKNYTLTHFKRDYGIKIPAKDN